MIIFINFHKSFERRNPEKFQQFKKVKVLKTVRDFKRKEAVRLDCLRNDFMLLCYPPQQLQASHPLPSFPFLV